MILLGSTRDGTQLFYDAALYEFRLGRKLVEYSEVRALDLEARIAWGAPEQRDWFYRIDLAVLDRCNREALQNHGDADYGLTPQDQVAAHAKRDDSILTGKIVEADPSLVQAVALALEDQGLLGQQALPQMAVSMPAGMESLAQLQRQPQRKMTVLEHVLMRQILKNDDKAKAKREREQDAVEQAVAKDVLKAAKHLESHSDISKGQRFMAKREQADERKLRSRSQNMQVEKDTKAQAKREAFEEDMGRLEASTASRVIGQPAVPGMQSDGRRHSHHQGMSLNGRNVNPDGTPKKGGLFGLFGR